MLLVTALLVPLTAFPATIQPGTEAPDFTLTDSENNEFSLSDFRGKVVLLDLVGWNCQPCIEDAIGVEAIWQDFKDDEFQVLGLDFWNGTAQNVQTFIDQTSATFPVLRDAGFLSLSSQYGITFDNFVIIDPEGIVRYTSENEAFNPFNDEVIRQIINEHLPKTVEQIEWAAFKGLYR